MQEYISRIHRYHSHWIAQPSQPPSIRVLEALFARLNKHSWRPDPDTFPCVDHRLITHSRATYEEIIPDYNGEDVESINLSKEDIFRAQKREIRHRVYRAIYWGNLFDHIFPIETRYYSLSTDRLMKLCFIVLVTSLIYLGVTILPSWLSDKLERTTAIEATSNSPLLEFLSDDGLKDKFFISAGVPEPKLPSVPDEEDIIQLKIKLQELVNKADINISNWSLDVGWLYADDIDRNNALVDKIFFEILSSNGGNNQQILFDKRIVVTPSSNVQEIMSQIFILFFTILMISWFLSKKRHFCDIIDKLHESKRIPATQLLEETLVSNFYLRKKFHYLVAATAAFIVIFLHFYFMQTLSHEDAYGLSLALGLSIHDYRIAASSQWIILVYWVAQFFLIYFFTLAAWELGALNSCMKQWQGKLAKTGVAGGHDFRDLFRDTKTNQVTTLMYIFIYSFIISISSWLKMENLGISFYYNWEEIVSGELSSLLTSSNAYMLYVYSPPILFLLVAWFATQRCFDNETDAVKYVEKHFVEIDKMIKAAQQDWKQLKTATEWLEDLDSLNNNSEYEEQHYSNHSDGGVAQ